MQILYNARYGDYVLLFHSDTPKFTFPTMGVARAKDIKGKHFIGLIHLILLNFNPPSQGIVSQDCQSPADAVELVHMAMMSSFSITNRINAM